LLSLVYRISIQKVNKIRKTKIYCTFFYIETPFSSLFVQEKLKNFFGGSTKPLPVAAAAPEPLLPPPPLCYVEPRGAGGPGENDVFDVQYCLTQK
jgi:hypothetical protein